MADRSYSIEYGNRCRQIRMAKGLSQQALAEKMNTTAQNVSKWEREGIANVDIVMKLSEVLGQDITADEIDQEGSVGEIGKEILNTLVKNEGYCEFQYLVINLFGLPAERISNEIFKLERIGNVVREQYRDWMDEERDGVFITAKGIITIKNLLFLPNLEELQNTVPYEKRIEDHKNFNDRIQKDEVSKLIWKLPDEHSSYRASYIYYLMNNFREVFPNHNSEGIVLRDELWNQRLLSGEDCFFDTLYCMAFGLENIDFELDEDRIYEYDRIEDEEDQQAQSMAIKEGYKHIDWKVRESQEKFEKMCPWIGPILQDVADRNREIVAKVEDAIERKSDSLIRPSDYLDEIEVDWEGEFDKNVGQNAEKTCDEWFSSDQIIAFIEKNYKPAKTDHEKKVDEIIKKINELNPETMDYYYNFPDSWEENGLAQKIRDVWNLPTPEEYHAIETDE